MTLEALNDEFGHGGAHLSDEVLRNILKEEQGLTFDLLAGAGANTDIALAAISDEDTIIMALNNNAGTITDIKGTETILDKRASGTLTAVSAIAGDTVTVNGRVYTAVAGVPANHSEFSIDTGDNETATSLAAQINARESFHGEAVRALAATNVVTVTAVVEGTGGNAITISSTGGTITASGATLANGVANGAIQFTGVTNQVLLLWKNKR
jgi:hypothetical protein